MFRFFLLLIIAVSIGVYRREILDFAVENFDICKSQSDDEIAIVESETEKPIVKEEKTTHEEIPKPKYWLLDDDPETNLPTVDVVLERVGLEKFNGSLKSESPHEGWNILWSTKNVVALNWKELKFHQKFNHFPFSKYLSSKSYFGTHTDSKYVPKAFVDGDELKKYAKINRNKKFVKKSKTKGGVKMIKNVVDFALTQDDDYFAQEYVDNPLLFDGHKFEISIFVLISSVDPLRLYYYAHNMIMKFCPEKYDSDDYVLTDSYVVGKSHIAGMDFEGTRDYFLNSYTFREALNIFVRKQGGDYDEMWKKIEDCIRSIVVGKEKSFIDYFAEIKEHKYPYFELFSFDFLIDTSFDPHLININSNPDLSVPKNYIRFRPSIEAVLYNAFKILGVATPYLKKEFLVDTMETEMMISHPNMRSVMPEFCMFDCDRECGGKCSLCFQCMQRNMFYETIVAHQEQMNIGDFKRLFPPEKEYLAEVGESYKDQIEDRSLFQLEWFIELCKKNRYFC